MVHHRRAFTLVELLVVIGIILAVSAIALPTVLSAMRDRQAGDAARILHAALVGARDAAANSGGPRGLRFIPDPSIPPAYLPNSNQLDPSRALACNRWVQTEVPPDYAAGACSIYRGANYAAITGGVPCLVLEEQPGHFEPGGAGYTWVADEPANWWWTVRVGERVRLRGQVLTVCGPMVITPAAGTGNVEQFANAGDPGVASPWSRTYTAPDGTQVSAHPQFLFLVNGKDDNHDGFADSGWDGLDNDGDGLMDEADEWEAEAWPSTLNLNLAGMSYSIGRRPVPSPGQQATTLPSSIVIDLTTWSTTAERSHLPVDPYTGQVDLIIEADGSVRQDLTYGTRSSLGMGSGLLHFWLADRRDVRDANPVQGSYLSLPVPPVLAGARYLVQVQSGTGRITTGELDQFAADPMRPEAALVPFLPYRQGQ